MEWGAHQQRGVINGAGLGIWVCRTDPVDFIGVDHHPRLCFCVMPRVTLLVTFMTLPCAGHYPVLLVFSKGEEKVRQSSLRKTVFREPSCCSPFFSGGGDSVACC
eukprot:EG_transcript_18048